MRISLVLFLLVSAASSAQQIPAPNDLPEDPFYIKKTWPIAGTRDSLNYLALDPEQLHLFLAYRWKIAVDDLESGATIGTISGTHGAYGMALDDTAEFGYLSDGQLNQIDVFDRRSLKVVGIIPTAPNPTIVLFEPASALIFVICNQPLQEKFDATHTLHGVSGNQRLRSGLTADELLELSPPKLSSLRHPRAAKPPPGPESKWFLTVIDAETWKALADIQLPGKVAFAQTAGSGHVYMGFPDRGEVARLDAVELRNKLLSNIEDLAPATTPREEQLTSGRLFQPDSKWTRDPGEILDWSDPQLPSEADIRPITFFRLQRECADPRTLAVDEHHLQLFVACAGMKLAVLNADNGTPETMLSTGPDTRAVAYDYDRRLIYAANAGGNGSLTFIRQDVTDTYKVIQNLPTPHWARALAINPVTGQIYLMTDYTDSDSQQRLSSDDRGSFQLLLIAH